MTLWTLLAAQAATTEFVDPGENWCSIVNSAKSGDEIVLRAGDHAGPCAITVAGVTLRGEPARIVYSGSSSNVIDVKADDVTLIGLQFGPTNSAIDAIKIKSGSRTHVEGCSFTQVGGISVAANSSDSSGIVIRDNRFTDLQSTGVYLGCHSGASSCASTDFLIEGNVIDGVTSSSGVGYGIEIKVDSWGVLRDNVIRDARGPAIHIFGSYDDGRVSLVEGNYLLDSWVNNTLEIGGGPAVVRNNIVHGDATYALYVYDYGGRGITRDVQVLGNTFDGDVGLASGVWKSGLGHAFQDNALTTALPSPISGVPMDGNVRCDGSCWTGDYWPIDGGPLTTGGVNATDLVVDFCGQDRSDPPHVGALQRTGGPAPELAIDFKSTFGCGESDTDTDADSDTDTDTDTDSDTDTQWDSSADTSGPQNTDGGSPDGGCGCASPGSASFLLVLLLPLVARRGERR